MNQTIISRFGMSVFVDGNSLQDLPLVIPENVFQLTWTNNKTGNIFYLDNSQEKITEFPAWAQTCVNVYDAHLPPPAPAPTPEELNKREASNMLYATDWTTIPDITDPAKSTPALTNQAEFLAYRNQLRAIAVNPPTTLVTLPIAPKPKWSA